MLRLLRDAAERGALERSARETGLRELRVAAEGRRAAGRASSETPGAHGVPAALVSAKVGREPLSHVAVTGGETSEGWAAMELTLRVADWASALSALAVVGAKHLAV